MTADALTRAWDSAAARREAFLNERVSCDWRECTEVPLPRRVMIGSGVRLAPGPDGTRETAYWFCSSQHQQAAELAALRRPDCVWCNKSFEPKKPKTNPAYCSRKCSRTAHDVLSRAWRHLAEGRFPAAPERTGKTSEAYGRQLAAVDAAVGELEMLGLNWQKARRGQLREGEYAPPASSYADARATATAHQAMGKRVASLAAMRKTVQESIRFALANEREAEAEQRRRALFTTPAWKTDAAGLLGRPAVDDGTEVPEEVLM